MIYPRPIGNILQGYTSENPGVLTNLVRLLSHGNLGGTGRLIILPVDQGFEHGPLRSFSPNPLGFDPSYHFDLALEAGLSAIAAPLGFLEATAKDFAGSIPTILKLNSATSLVPSSSNPQQGMTASVADALRLGCAGVGFTVYPGSDATCSMLSSLQPIIQEAKAHGLLVVVWAYSRGHVTHETALDVVAYAAHIGALMGAHIIKVKVPSPHLHLHTTPKELLANVTSLKECVRCIVQCCFNGKRLVVFSGGHHKDLSALYGEVKAIHQGGGNGSIIGRNAFQRPKKQALEMMKNIIDIYKNTPLD